MATRFDGDGEHDRDVLRDNAASLEFTSHALARFHCENIYKMLLISM